LNRFVAVAAAVAGLSLPFDAFANGRFPRSERLLEDPSNPAHLLLAATYGILTTSDHGANWYLLCDAAFSGDDNYSGDPILDLVGGEADGAGPISALVDVQAGLRRSDDLCTWSLVLGSDAGLANQNFNDFAVDRAHRDTIVAVVTQAEDGATSITLRQSDDGGLTWRAMGTRLPLAVITTIDLDPSDSNRIFASGMVSAEGGLVGAFLKSVDHGATWSTTIIPNTDPYNVPYIAGVDTHDSNRIFVRTDAFASSSPTAPEVANDALLVTTDSGMSWTEVLRKNAKLLGFALSPDGSTVLIGYGDPVDSGYSVDPSVTGIYQASATGLSFVQVFSGSVTCLTWTQQAVYACTIKQDPGSLEELLSFGAAAITSGMATPTSLLRLGDIRGPIPCCAAASNACQPWTLACVSFNACSDGGNAVPSCDEDGGADATIGDAGHSAPDATLDAAPEATSGTLFDGGSSDAVSEPQATLRTSGCTCSAPGASSSRQAVGCVLSTGLFGIVLRRRRRALRSR
jgi:hypothetical protein